MEGHDPPKVLLELPHLLFMDRVYCLLLVIISIKLPQLLLLLASYMLGPQLRLNPFA